MAASLAAALDALKAARLAEGRGAGAGPARRWSTGSRRWSHAAETEAAAQSLAIRDRFARRMAELLGRGRDLQDRIVQEAAVMAAKADVREELDRLTSHVGAARALMAGEARRPAAGSTS